MDESGKNIIKQTNQYVFIFGGIVIEKDNVYKALDDFKKIYQEAKFVLRKNLRKKITSADRAERIKKIIEKFELHAVEMFNPKDNLTKKGVIRRENPWQYYPETEIYRVIHNILIKLSPYISNVQMYKVDKSKIMTYFKENGISPDDQLVYEYMIKFVIREYDQYLHRRQKKGALVLDNLDSSFREKFVEYLSENRSQLLWTEPVIVDSISNAFMQLTDIILFCYRIMYLESTHQKRYRTIEKVYNKFIKSLVIEKDLMVMLSQPNKPLRKNRLNFRISNYNCKNYKTYAYRKKH